MQFPKGSGLDALDKVVRKSLHYYAGELKTDQLRKNILHTLNKTPTIKIPSLDQIKRPLESMIKSLNNTVSQFTSKPEKIDYTAVVNSFLPPGARLLKPQYPEGSEEIQFEDFDGDGNNELVTSYKTSDGVKTLVLKKDEVQWYKMAEISNPEFESIHYRNSADISGDGKKYMLLGLNSRQKYHTIFAYSLSDGGAKKIFNKNYDKMELQKTRSSAGQVKDALAIWNEETEGIYNIDLVHWNGIDLENMDQSRYLIKKVVPYYASKLKRNPNDATSWYNLADSLSKSGNKASASRVLSLGLEHKPDGVLRDKFNELKSRL